MLRPVSNDCLSLQLWASVSGPGASSDCGAVNERNVRVVKGYGRWLRRPYKGTSHLSGRRLPKRRLFRWDYASGRRCASEIEGGKDFG